jgi:TRAP transporter TAXI family solute receptor
MSQRLAAILALAAFALVVAAGLVTGGRLGRDDDPPGRISFQIATGSTDGIYFPVGQAMAGLISHPLGVGRCDTATVCGPAGLVLSARTSQGSADNLRDVNQGLVDSGLADGDIIAEAVAGHGAFRGRPLRHLRVIAALFAEEEHLVAASASNIHTVADLRGKRVMLGGAANSGGVARARAILAAFRVGRVRLVPFETGNPAQLLREGKLDAYFTLAGVPLESVKSLLADGKARLVPIDGEGRARLIRTSPELGATAIPIGAYPGSGAVETVFTRAYWVTRDSEPDSLIYGITRALFNPANRPELLASHPSARDIGLDSAAISPPAPLHPGAARFYREAGKLPR